MEMNSHIFLQVCFPFCSIQVALGNKNAELLKQTQVSALNVF